MLLSKHNSFCYIWHMLSKISSGQQLTPHTLDSFFMDDQEPSKLENIVKVTILLWSAILLTLSYIEPPDGKKIVDFDPTFIASIFSASTASLGLSIKGKNNNKGKDVIVDNKDSKSGIK